MALAIDATTPARFSLVGVADNVDVFSNSFTPPLGALLVCCVCADQTGGVGTATAVAVSDTEGFSWSERAHRDDADAGAPEGHASIWTAEVTNSAVLAVAVRRTGTNGGTDTVSAKVYVVTGWDTADPIGAAGEGSSTTNNLTASILTGEAADSLGFVCATEWNQLGTPASSDLTEDAADYSGAISVLSGYKALGAAGAETANLDAGGTGAASWNWVAVEVKAAGGGGGRTTRNTRAFPLGVEVGMGFQMCG